MDEKICFICGAEVPEYQERIVKALGLKSLIDASIKRKDQKHLQLKRKAEILVHRSCQTKYLLASNIKKAAEDTQPGPSSDLHQKLHLLTLVICVLFVMKTLQIILLKKN